MHSLTHIYIMRYACQIWGQQSHSKTFDMIQSAQNKALIRIINFKQSMEPPEPLSKTQNK